jgi:ABC-type uncharacterized transport system permease subunit
VASVFFKERTRNFGLVYAIMGAAFVILGAVYLTNDTQTTLRFSRLGTLKTAAGPLFLLLGILQAAVGTLCMTRRYPTAALHNVGLVINTAILVAVVLFWAGTIKRMEVIGLAAQSLRLATPIGLGAMAGILCERCGVVNIAIEGMMLTAACIGFMICLETQNMIWGLAAAVLAGGLMASLHAVLSIHLMVDQIVSGTVINILAVGVTGFVRRAVLLTSTQQSLGVFPTFKIPFLSDIPVIGKIFFSHQPMVYSMVILVIVLHFVIFYTRWGLRTRTVGEHPRAADALGINVYRVRYVNVILGGMVAGLGGAWFSLETVGNFHEIMTGGKGFIALAAMIFGKWCPFGAIGGALLFGFADALQIKLQILGVNIPYQFLGMIPYLITMVILAGVIGRAVAPAADGIPYDREG